MPEEKDHSYEQRADLKPEEPKLKGELKSPPLTQDEVKGFEESVAKMGNVAARRRMFEEKGREPPELEIEGQRRVWKRSVQTPPPPVEQGASDPQTPEIVTKSAPPPVAPKPRISSAGTQTLSDDLSTQRQAAHDRQAQTAPPAINRAEPVSEQERTSAGNTQKMVAMFEEMNKKQPEPEIEGQRRVWKRSVQTPPPPVEQGTPGPQPEIVTKSAPPPVAPKPKMSSAGTQTPPSDVSTRQQATPDIQPKALSQTAPPVMNRAEPVSEQERTSAGNTQKMVAMFEEMNKKQPEPEIKAGRKWERPPVLSVTPDPGPNREALAPKGEKIAAITRNVTEPNAAANVPKAQVWSYPVTPGAQTKQVSNEEPVAPSVEGGVKEFPRFNRPVISIQHSANKAPSPPTPAAKPAPPPVAPKSWKTAPIPQPLSVVDENETSGPATATTGTFRFGFAPDDEQKTLSAQRYEEKEREPRYKEMDDAIEEGRRLRLREREEQSTNEYARNEYMPPPVDIPPPVVEDTGQQSTNEYMLNERISPPVVEDIESGAAYYQDIRGPNLPRVFEESYLEHGLGIDTDYHIPRARPIEVTPPGYDELSQMPDTYANTAEVPEPIILASQNIREELEPDYDDEPNPDYDDEPESDPGQPLSVPQVEEVAEPEIAQPMQAEEEKKEEDRVVVQTVSETESPGNVENEHVDLGAEKTSAMEILRLLNDQGAFKVCDSDRDVGVHENLENIPGRKLTEEELGKASVGINEEGVWKVDLKDLDVSPSVDMRKMHEVLNLAEGDSPKPVISSVGRGSVRFEEEGEKIKYTLYEDNPQREDGRNTTTVNIERGGKKGKITRGDDGNLNVDLEEGFDVERYGNDTSIAINDPRTGETREMTVKQILEEQQAREAARAQEAAQHPREHTKDSITAEPEIVSEKTLVREPTQGQPSVAAENETAVKQPEVSTSAQVDPVTQATEAQVVSNEGMKNEVREQPSVAAENETAVKQPEVSTSAQADPVAQVEGAAVSDEEKKIEVPEIGADGFMPLGGSLTALRGTSLKLKEYYAEHQAAAAEGRGVTSEITGSARDMPEIPVGRETPEQSSGLHEPPARVTGAKDRESPSPATSDKEQKSEMSESSVDQFQLKTDLRGLADALHSTETQEALATRRRGQERMREKGAEIAISTGRSVTSEKTGEVAEQSSPVVSSSEKKTDKLPSGAEVKTEDPPPTKFHENPSAYGADVRPIDLSGMRKGREEIAEREKNQGGKTTTAAVETSGVPEKIEVKRDEPAVQSGAQKDSTITTPVNFVKSMSDKELTEFQHGQEGALRCAKVFSDEEGSKLLNNMTRALNPGVSQQKEMAQLQAKKMEEEKAANTSVHAR